MQSRELTLRDIRKDKREVDFVCSTEAIDSYGTILKANWDLSRYVKNPVVLYAHDSRSLPIGKAKNVRVEGKELLATVVFATERANPLAEQVWQCVLEETLRGISVGFYPRTVREEKLNDEYVLILDDNELRELSVCPVPSNPEALAQLRMRAAGAAGAEPDKTKAHGAPTTPATERGEAGKDQRMDLEKENAALKTKLEERGAELNTANKELLTARSTIATLEKQNGTLVTERDAAMKRAEKAEEADLVRHVDSFLGKKFDKAERDDQLELARTNRPLFDKLIAQRSDIPMKVETTVMGDTKPEKREHTEVEGNDDDGTALLRDFKSGLKKGGA